jgi:hypothetical protein
MAREMLRKKRWCEKWMSILECTVGDTQDSARYAF